MSDNELNNTDPKDRQEIIHAIAKSLSARRLERKLSLKQASQTLKIRVPFLEAIERGDWHELPAEVYVRGFVLRYAQYLGLDGQALLEPYLLHSKRERRGGGGPPVEDASRSELRGMGWIWMGLVVMAFFGLLNFLKPERPAVDRSTPPVTPAVEPSTGAAPTPPVVASPVPHVLNVYTIEPLWMRVTTESQSFEGFIPQNNTWTWKADGEFDIRLGHSRQVNLHFDGEQIPLGEKQRRVVLPDAR